MIKLVALFKIKEGMTREAFIDYYENNHVPLVKKLMPQLRYYRRSFVRPETMFYAGHMEGAAPPPPPFDVMTECWFESQKHYDAMIAVTADPDKGPVIAADEANFLDRSSMTMFLVDERITDMPVTSDNS
ncbi:EthD domain-containing protein [Sphingomonadaceae bacterium G21617-S1]|nr:EthD domain-containing protein [Sphingomonadaceae bacterium G21617-S1]